MIEITEAKKLQAALQALQDPPDSTHLPALSRAVSRAADDLELVAEETADRNTRKSLLVTVAHSRKAVIAARKRARQAALTVDRSQLFEGAQEVPKKKDDSDAAQLAREINDSLRRTAAIVSEEIDRSRAAGNIVEQSTRRLRMTRDQHTRYGDGLSSGSQTLKTIQRTEIRANILIVLSFALFFLAAAHVTRRRIANSNVSTFIIRPGMTVASIPMRIVGWMVRAVGGGPREGAAENPRRRDSSSARLADEAERAKEGREATDRKAESLQTHIDEPIGVDKPDANSVGEVKKCGATQQCTLEEMNDGAESIESGAVASIVSDSPSDELSADLSNEMKADLVDHESDDESMRSAKEGSSLSSEDLDEAKLPHPEDDSSSRENETDSSKTVDTKSGDVDKDLAASDGEGKKEADEENHDAEEGATEGIASFEDKPATLHAENDEVLRQATGTESDSVSEYEKVFAKENEADPWSATGKHQHRLEDIASDISSDGGEEDFAEADVQHEKDV